MQTDRGLLIAFDGPPRSGRTHQADALAAALTADGHEVVRASMPADVIPVAKTTLGWVEERLDAYADLARNLIRPALETGAIVILDGGITSVLIRARAVLGGRAPTGLLYVFDVRAMREAEVDLEWIFLDERKGERKSPGFSDSAAEWKIAACSHAKGKEVSGPFMPKTFPDSASCGSRRHATYLMRGDHADAAMDRFPTIVTSAIAERMDPLWQTAVHETRAERDLAVVARRLEQWAGEKRNPMPLYGVVGQWAMYDEAARLAVVEALPQREGATGDFRTMLSAVGVQDVGGEAGEALRAREAATVVATAVAPTP